MKKKWWDRNLPEESLTQARLKELLQYDPYSGIFIRIKHCSPNAMPGMIAGSKNDQGYIIISIDGHKHRAHRLAFLYIEGAFPPFEVDHIDRNRSNNKWDNIRKADRLDNLVNRALNRNNISGVKGVYFDNTRSCWVAHATVNYEKIQRRFKDKEEAISQRMEWEIEYGL